MNTSGRTRLRLADGRDLDVHESGPQGGEVLLFHHGTPGSGAQMRAMADAAHRLGLRLVSASRPGYGDSARFTGRSIVDVVGDSEAILDALGADRCYVAGWSGGGPHALACGARLSERVRAVLVIAGVAPYESPDLNFLAGMGEENLIEFGKVLEGEEVLRSYLEEQRANLVHATVPELVEAFGSILPPVDRGVFTGEIGEDLAAAIQEGLRVGIDGWLDDDLSFVKPWGFALAEITTPTLLWQGSEDLMVPFAHGKWLAERIPGVVAHLEEGEGHLSIALGSIDLMLQALVATA
jgi:pimeloyl-ACP methyl ester carboxylesterase